MQRNRRFRSVEQDADAAVLAAAANDCTYFAGETWPGALAYSKVSSNTNQTC
jgi:hypothetical protein